MITDRRASYPQGRLRLADLLADVGGFQNFPAFGQPANIMSPTSVTSTPTQNSPITTFARDP
jgi:hypothetical protein